MAKKQTTGQTELMDYMHTLEGPELAALRAHNLELRNALLRAKGTIDALLALAERAYESSPVMSNLRGPASVLLQIDTMLQLTEGEQCA